MHSHPLIKKVIRLALVLLAIFGCASLVVPWFINAEEKQQAITKFLQTEYDLTLESSGDVATTTFPSPSLSIPNVSIKNPEGSNLLSASSIQLDIGWTGLIQQKASTILLVRPEIVFSSEQFNELLDFFSSSESVKNNSPIARIHVMGGSVNIQNKSNKSQFSMKEINASIDTPQKKRPIKISASGIAQDVPVDITLFFDASSKQKAIFEMLLNGHSSIKLQGAKGDGVDAEWKGEISADLADIGEFSTFVAGKKLSPGGQAFPLRFTGNASVSDHHLIINRTDALLDQQAGSFAGFVGWEENPVFAIELNTKSINIQHFIGSLENSMFPVIPIGANAAAIEKLAPVKESVSLILNADEAIVYQKKYKNLRMATELDKGDLIVHSGTLDMPGETMLDIQGAVVQLPEGRRFSGVAKVSGKHLNEWIADFEPYAKNLPADDFSDFLLEGNLFISAEQLRLSEAELNIKEFELIGGFATYFEKMPRVEAEVKLKDANLDYFRDAWRLETNVTKDAEYQLLTGNQSQFDWLKRLPAILDLSIAIDGFRFLDNDGSLATMRLYVTPGELSLYGIDARFPGNTLSGNIKFNVLGDRPKLDVVTTINNLNTDYFSKGDNDNDIPLFDVNNTKERFSDELFDVRWMSTLDGSIDLSVNSLEHSGKEYPNFKWRADLEKTAMTIQKLTFEYLGGSFDLNGTFIGGKVPGLSASFALYNADLKELLKDYFNTESIEGRISLTGVTSTSGIHMKSWIKQGDMKLTAVARGVRVQNLNLKSVLDTTAAARSTQDVAEGVRSLVFDGTTELTVDGNINFQQGEVKTPGIRLTADRITGLLKGELQLLPWVLSLNTQWQFPELSSTTVPTMSMSQQGEINDYTTRIDTASLEAFVAKRIISQ